MNNVKRRRWLWIVVPAFVVIALALVAMNRPAPRSPADEGIVRLAERFGLELVSPSRKYVGPGARIVGVEEYYFSDKLSPEEQANLVREFGDCTRKFGLGDMTGRYDLKPPGGPEYHRDFAYLQMLSEFSVTLDCRTTDRGTTTNLVLWRVEHSDWDRFKSHFDERRFMY